MFNSIKNKKNEKDGKDGKDGKDDKATEQKAREGGLRSTACRLTTAVESRKVFVSLRSGGGWLVSLGRRQAVMSRWEADLKKADTTALLCTCSHACYDSV